MQNNRQFAILGKTFPGQQKNFRGTGRSRPRYQEALDKTHPANESFLWYSREMHEMGEDALVYDLEKARLLVTRYRQLSPPQFFEIIELTFEDTPPGVSEELLGYDVSDSYNSLLELHLSSPALENPEQQDEGFRRIVPLLELLKRYFQPLLNENGLFETYEIANFCLDCMMALQTLRPGLYEDETHEFFVIGLWRVP